MKQFLSAKLLDPDTLRSHFSFYSFQKKGDQKSKQFLVELMKLTAHWCVVTFFTLALMCIFFFQISKLSLEHYNSWDVWGRLQPGKLAGMTLSTLIRTARLFFAMVKILYSRQNGHWTVIYILHVAKIIPFQHLASGKMRTLNS